MFTLYTIITSFLGIPLTYLLKRRVKLKKEDKQRLQERMGQYTQKRPEGRLIWVHAASVGEAQSALIIIQRLIQDIQNINVLVTTGTVTSAKLMQARLPEKAFHQFYPLDHPQWTKSFLEHWKPDLAIWMESELWPNMLTGLKDSNITTILINARLSQKSYAIWRLFLPFAKRVLQTFDLIIAQSEQNGVYFKKLGHRSVVVTDNLKYSATSLPVPQDDYKKLQKAIHGRPIWVYASTHEGEEELACQTHLQLKKDLPDLLTIIVPRHPERGQAVKELCDNYRLNSSLRSQNPTIFGRNDIYIADTLGELGLFYALSPLALIGRSFSNDGGGGHNPIEAAQFGCAVLTGPNIQYQEEIFKDMLETKAAVQLNKKEALAPLLLHLLQNQSDLAVYQKKAQEFADSKTHVIDSIMKEIEPYINKAIQAHDESP